MSALLSASMALSRAMLLRPLLAAAKRPEKAQTAALRRILSANADTEFGRAHGFRHIRTLSEWRRAVPMRGFEELRPWIDRQAETGASCLTVEQPAMYNLTSGTTAKPKLAPVTRSGVVRIGRDQRIFAAALHGLDSSIFAGRVVGIGSPAVEGRLASGVPFGSVTGRIYRDMPRLIRRRYVLPAEIFSIADYDAKYRAIGTLLLAERDVSVVSTANPSTLLRVLGVIRENLDDMLRDLSSGRLSVELGLAEADEAAVRAAFRSDQSRVRELAQLASGGRLSYAAIWPRLRAVACWTGGSCGVALAALKAELPADARCIEVGYVSSEFRGTINVDPARGLCLPTLRSNVLEFFDPDATETQTAECVGLHELEEGRRYRVSATTPDGLYRYDINDIVEVVGRVRGCPALAFVQKGRGTTSITGEKLHESQMTEALSMAAAAAGLKPIFYLALADEQAALYRVHLEAEGPSCEASGFQHALDTELRARNLEYAAKRASRRLAPPQVVRLKPGAADAYRRHCVAAGQRDGQFKVLPLRYAREVAFDFTPWRLQ